MAYIGGIYGLCRAYVRLMRQTGIFYWGYTRGEHEAKMKRTRAVSEYIGRLIKKQEICLISKK